MNSLDFQQLARDAENKAWEATSDHLRACWLDVAQAWLDLAKVSAMIAVPTGAQETARKISHRPRH